MEVTQTALSGVLLLQPTIHRDERGHFLETWRADRHTAAGLPPEFVQDNVSVSRAGVLRGLHYQHPTGQGKLVSALSGVLFDVAVDIRQGSATFGRWVGYELSGDNGRQLFIPPGFAHGLVVLSDAAVVSYKCTAYYRPAEEGCVRWDDPRIGIEWPVREPILSPKDAAAPGLLEIPEDRLPKVG